MSNPLITAVFVRINEETGLYSNYSPADSPCHSFLRLAVRYARPDSLDYKSWNSFLKKTPTYDFFADLADVIAATTYIRGETQ